MLFVPATVGASFMMPICRVLFIAGLIAMATASCYGYQGESGAGKTYGIRRTMQDALIL